MKSMTSFARVGFGLNGVEYFLEVRSVNSRFREVSLRLPPPLNDLEDHIRQAVAQYVDRGRIHLTVMRESTAHQMVDVEVNEELARKYHEALIRLKEDLGVHGNVDMSVIAGLSDLFTIRWPKVDEEELWAQFMPVLKEALESFVEMRLKEGENLKEDIAQRIDAIETALANLETFKDAIMDDYATRLKERVRRLTEGMEMDEQRLLMEVALVADRCDITEEVVRTRSHLKQFRELLEADEPVGRKMDFLVQELNREVNTIGSKANSAQIARVVVEGKSEIEKIREQLQNVE